MNIKDKIEEAKKVAGIQNTITSLEFNLQNINDHKTEVHGMRFYKRLCESLTSEDQLRVQRYIINKARLRIRNMKKDIVSLSSRTVSEAEEIVSINHRMQTIEYRIKHFKVNTYISVIYESLIYLVYETDIFNINRYIENKAKGRIRTNKKILKELKR